MAGQHAEQRGAHRRQEDLYALVDRLGLTEDEARWLEALPGETRARWAAVLEPSPQSFGIAAELLGGS